MTKSGLSRAHSARLESRGSRTPESPRVALLDLLLKVINVCLLDPLPTTSRILVALVLFSTSSRAIEMGSHESGTVIKDI